MSAVSPSLLLLSGAPLSKAGLSISLLSRVAPLPSRAATITSQKQRAPSARDGQSTRSGPRASIRVHKTKDAMPPRLSGARDFPTFHRALRIKLYAGAPVLASCQQAVSPKRGGTRLGLNKVGPRGEGWG